MNSQKEIAQSYIEIGKKKVQSSLLIIFILSIYGGIFISSSSLCSLICSFRLSEGNSSFYSGLVFPIGLMLVLCTGAELFTENSLLVIPLLCNQISISEMLLNWLIVYFGNLIGAIFMAFVIVYGHITHLFDYSLASIVLNNAIEKTTMGFGEALVKGILGNFFICLSVWMSLAGKDLFSKIIGLWFPALLMMASGYEHIVNNMFYIPAGLFASYEYNLSRPNLNWGRFIYKNLIPVTLGNILGGTILVGLSYWFIYLKQENKDIFIDKNVVQVNNQVNQINSN